MQILAQGHHTTTQLSSILNTSDGVKSLGTTTHSATIYCDLQDQTIMWISPSEM